MGDGSGRLLAAAGAACALLLAAGEAGAAASKPQTRFIPANPGNYTARGGRTIDHIVIHTVEGSEAGCISWFQNPRSKVSAHYVVGHGGRITQMVADGDIAWHAGNWNMNTRAIGIENEGYAWRNTWTGAQYDALARLVAHLCDRYGIPVDRSHVIGHVEVPGATHTDPGPHFDWSRFMSDVRRVSGGGGGGGGSGQTGGGGGQTGGGSAPKPPPATAPVARGASVTASRLNVRTGPWGTILGSVAYGREFVLTGQTKGDWRQIFWGGRRAWVHGAYLRGAGGAAAEIAVDRLNVRTGPSTGYGRIGLVLGGQRYFHLGSGAGGSWRRIQLDDRAGWSYAPYTRSVNVGR